MALEVVILAAGKGKRMHSKKPKVLHTIANKPLLQHVIEQSQQVSAAKIHVVFGHQGELVQSAIDEPNINWVHQQQQLGTGHAVLQALEYIEPANDVLVLVSDIPLLQSAQLEQLINQAEGSDLTLLTAEVDNPFGLGRIVYQDGQISAIVEEKDATDSQRQIKEINSGVMICKAQHLQRWLPALKATNAQGEFYLTDIVSFALNENLKISKHMVDNAAEVQGINDLIQLEAAERAYQLRQVESLMAKGLIVKDKHRIDIRGQLICGQDIEVEPNVIFEGKVLIEDNVIIGANCIIKDSTISTGAVIHPNSIIEGATVGSQASVGPFARLRAGSELGMSSKVGNFVEVKKAQLGDGAKASHLSYVGDAVIGQNVNIGAGTITCNYDGVNKHQTIIGDEAFIGSGTQLVAPIEVGAGATIGAGTTLRRNAPQGELTLTASPQRTIKEWQRPKKHY